MADDVEIRGGGDLDGAVLRNAATESTLKRLVELFEKKFGAGAGSKISETNEKAVKNNITAMKSSTKLMSTYENTLEKINQRSSNLTKKFSEMSDVSIDRFAKSINNNNQILAAFGGTITQGTQRFNSLSNDLNSSDIGKNFIGMGTTVDELNRYMADYLEIEMKAGRLKNLTDEQIIEGTQKYILEIDRLTKATGLSREQQADAFQAAMKDSKLLSLQNRLNGESAEKFRSAVTLMQSQFDPQIMKTLTNMMQGVVDPSDKFAKRLSVAAPTIMEFNKAIGQGKISTEQQIEGYKKQSAAITEFLKSQSSEQIAKDKQLEKLQEFNSSLQKIISANKQAKSDANLKNLSNFSTNIGSSSGLIASYNSTISKLNQGSIALSKQFLNIGSMAIGGIFSGIVGAGKMLLSFFTDSLDSFRETSNVGATFNNDLIELRRSAADAAMPLDLFTETIKNNSQLLAAFGGTVTQGAQRFSTLSKELRTGDIGQRFMGMGMTMSDLNQYMADYLDIELKTGKLQGRTDAQLLQGTQNYIMEMDKLTKVTGLSRQQQSDALRTAMRDGRILTLQNRLTGESAQNFRSAVTLMQTQFDPQIMGTMTNMMSGVIDPADQFAKRLAIASPGIMEFNRALGQGTLSTEEQIEGYKKQSASITDYLSRFSTEQVARDEQLQKLQQFNASLQNTINANTGAASLEQNQRKRVTEEIASFAQTIEKIKGDITVALIDSGVFKKLMNGLEGLATIFRDNVTKISPVITKFIGEFDQFITRFLDKINVDGIAGALGDFLKGLLARIFGTVTPEQQAKQTQNTEKIGTISEKQGSIQSRMRELQKGPSTMSSAKEMERLQTQLNDLTKEREKLISENNKIEDSIRSSLFSFDWSTIALGIGGLVTAMAAFSAGAKLFSRALTTMVPGITSLTPTIPVVLAFGAAIGMGGFGLGKALEGVSSIIESVGGIIEKTAKAFDMLPTSIKKFEDLNPEILKNVGKGLQELSGPIIASGFAGILASIGGDGLPKLAAAIKMFDSVDPSKIKDMGPALKSLNDGLAAISGGGILEAFSKSIGRFLSGDSGLSGLADSLKKFDRINLEQIKIIGPALESLTKGLSELTTGGILESLTKGLSTLTSGGILESLGKSISKLLASDSIGGLVNSLKKFDILNPEKIKDTGSALESLTKGLSTLTSGGILESLGKSISKLLASDSIGGLVNSLKKFDILNPEKIKDTGSALELLNKGLSTLTSGGILELLNKDLSILTNNGQGGVLQAFFIEISRLLTIDAGGISNLADSFKKFNDVDSNNLITLVSGLDNIKTKIGEDFGNQAKNIDTFADSVKNLRKDLEDLKTALDALNKGIGPFGVGASGIERLTGQMGQTGPGTTNAMLEEQKKLNTLMLELKSVFEATRDNTKDTADGVSGRRSLTER